MFDIDPRYMTGLRDALANDILPTLNDTMSKQIGMCALRIIGSRIAQAQALPNLRSEAFRALESISHNRYSREHRQGGGESCDGVDRLSMEKGELGSLEVDLQTHAERLLHHEEAVLDPTDWETIGKLAGIEKTMFEALVASILRETTSKAAREGKGLFGDAQLLALGEFIKRQFPAETDLQVLGAKEIPGGYSKQTVFITLGNCKGLPKTIVIRKDKRDAVVVSTVVNEFGILNRLYQAGVAVPRPLALECTGQILDGAFIVMEQVVGRNVGDALDVLEPRADVAKDLAKTMAKLHSVPADEFGDDIAGAHLPTEERMRLDIARVEADWRATHIPSSALEITFSWLKRNIRFAAGDRALIHRDIGCHNMLVNEDRVSALLDWELAAIGNPAQDLGYVYDSVVQMCGWEEFLAAYEKAGARVPSREQVEYYALWGNVWVTVLLMQCGAAFVSGATNNIQLGYCGEYFLPRMQLRVCEKLQKLLEAQLARNSR